MEIRRVLNVFGGSRSIKGSVRLVAATNEDLLAWLDSGEFRADLLTDLLFDVITLPPLREAKGRYL